MLLAEANQWPEDVSAYFGDGDECHMAYHFPLMPRIYMAIAQEDRFPIADILRQTPEIPANCQWALFLRNHDELTLEMVTDVERDYLWSTYANDPRARINLGIRRRLASLMDNDRRKIELMNSLLFSLPGTPIIYYGDEIGMGDNIYLGDRNGVRTPMQWTSDRNGGFSRCDPARLYLPVIMDPVYGHQSVNVEAQQRSPSSLLNWMKRLIGVRRSNNAFSRGTLRFIRPTNRTVIAYVRQHENETIVCVANLSRSAQAAEIDLSPWKGRVPMEMLGRTAFPRIGELPYLVTLPPYGFFWFLLGDQAEPERRSADRAARDHHTGVGERLGFAVGHPRTLCIRTRRAAAFPAGAPVVCREGARPAWRQARYRHSDWSVTASAPRWLLVSVPGEHPAADHVPLSASADGQMDALRSFRSDTRRRDRSRSPRLARGHPDRRRHRSGFRHAAASTRCTPATRRRRRAPAGSLADQRVRGRCRCPRVDKIAAPNREQSNTTVIVDADMRGEDFPQAQRRHVIRRSKSGDS